jgi:hypothetical protein
VSIPHDCLRWPFLTIGALEATLDPLASIEHFGLYATSSTRMFVFVQRASDVVPTGFAHVAKVALKDDCGNEHNADTKKAKDYGVRVKRDEKHHPKDKGQPSPLAVPSGVAIDRFIGNAVSKTRILRGERLFKFGKDSLFMLRQWHCIPFLDLSPLAFKDISVLNTTTPLG